MDKKISLIMVALLLIYWGAVEIVMAVNNGQTLNVRTDAYSEGNAIRSVDGFLSEGLTSNAGLPQIKFNNQFLVLDDQGRMIGYRLNMPYQADLTPNPPGSREVYTHYPPGPEYILFFFSKLAGPGQIVTFRIMAICLGLLAWGIFFRLLLKTYPPSVLIIVIMGLSLVHMTTTYLGGLHYQGYAQWLLVLQLGLTLYIFEKRKSCRTAPCLWFLMLLLAFIQGWLSFDYAFLVVFAALPCFFLARFGATDDSDTQADKHPLSPSFLLTALVVAGLGFTLAHGFHFLQVAYYYGSFTCAITDLTAAGIKRAGNVAVDGFPTLTRLEMLGIYMHDLFWYDTLLKPSPLVFLSGCVLLLLLIYLGKARLSIKIRTFDFRRIMNLALALISAYLVSSAWIFIMSNHAWWHIRFLARHFMLIYLMVFIALGLILKIDFKKRSR